jgi:hypothetical protein
MADKRDPLDQLLAMSLDEIKEQVKYAFEFYVEEEEHEPEVAKILAMQEFSIWYINDKEKENSLREYMNEL